MANLNERAAAFVADLQARREDRGLMANLRRGLSETTANRTWPYIARWCNLENDRQRTIFQTVAGSFAFNPNATSEGNMGTTMRQLATSDGRGADGLKTFETRFRRFLSCDSVFDVCDRLPTVIRTTQAKGVAINHEELFKDLHYWSDPVKIRWANRYWGNTQEGEIP